MMLFWIYVKKFYVDDMVLCVALLF